MPTNAFEIPDAGTVTVTFADGGRFDLDAYETYNAVLTLRDKNADADGTVEQFHASVAELLHARGLPRLNHFQVDAFLTRLGGAVASLKKTLEPDPTPDSQPSTGPAS